MEKNLQDLLEKFSSEVGEALIATGIVNLNGGLEAYMAHEIQGKDYNVQRTASIFAMIVNILNKTLDEIYLKQEIVDEVLVTTQKTHFLAKILAHDKYYHGITFTSGADVNIVRKLMENYKPLFVERLK